AIASDRLSTTKPSRLPARGRKTALRRRVVGADRAGSNPLGFRGQRAEGLAEAPDAPRGIVKQVWLRPDAAVPQLDFVLEVRRRPRSRANGPSDRCCQLV